MELKALVFRGKLALTLYYHKDTRFLWMIANAFGFHQYSASKIIILVSDAINRHLGPAHLHLPQDKDEMIPKVSEFELKFGIIQAFGCIDGTHIPPKTPNYKQSYLINIQAVWDYRGLFMDIECCWIGSTDNAKAFENSKINEKLTNSLLPTTFSCPVSWQEKIPNYLLGDSLYPLTPYCLKEYQSCSSDEELLFNTRLRAARNPVECTFGRLEGRSAILTWKIGVSSYSYLCLSCLEKFLRTWVLSSWRKSD